MHLLGTRSLLSAALIAALGLSTGLVSGTPAFAAHSQATKMSTKTHKHAKLHKHLAGNKIASHKHVHHA
jgi:hypothetical protein